MVVSTTNFAGSVSFLNVFTILALPRGEASQAHLKSLLELLYFFPSGLGAVGAAAKGVVFMAFKTPLLPKCLACG